MAQTRFSTSHLAWLRPFLFAIAVSLTVTTLARVILSVWQMERIYATGGGNFILLQGLRFDLVTLGMLLGIPMALTPLVSRIRPLHQPWFRALHWYLLLVVGLLVLMEVATPPFIAEYDVRPNLLFLEYLKYPKEVFSMLMRGYAMALLTVLVLVPAILLPVHRGLRNRTIAIPHSNAWSAAPLALLSLTVCFAAARSTLDHRPVNPSTVAFSPDTLVNSLPLNSLYSVAYALYELGYEERGYPYGEIDAAHSIAAVRNAMRLNDDAFPHPAIPTLHGQQATRERDHHKNLVIIIEESLGAEFVGRLGGLPLTPNLDRFADEGIWFERLYATGTRSARGLEAIVAGFPPTTSQSVLKLGMAQNDFFTLGEYLRRKGYATSFIYGGEAQFDNMKRFFAGNGFEKIIDKHDFVDPVFFGSWGASDEDVFNHAHAAFLAHKSDQPFFSVLFTTSNHSPWEYPDNRIEYYDLPRATVNNAVKYADYALGRYLRAARTSPYWDNTVFLVVSDHNSRVYGAELVPIERFHIPGLIVGGGIAAQKVTRVASQIDLLPTVLSLIGIDGEHPAVGIDLTRPDIDHLPQRAVMQYGDTQAYREGDRVVILRKDKPATTFSYATGTLEPAAADTELIDRALALSVWPINAYREHQYRLPDDAAGG